MDITTLMIEQLFSSIKSYREHPQQQQDHAIENLKESLAYCKRNRINIDHLEYGSRMNPLMVASWVGNTEAIKLILDAGANINYKNRRTSLIVALQSRQMDAALLLLDRGCDYNIPNRSNRNTPLMECCVMIRENDDDECHQPQSEYDGSSSNNRINNIDCIIYVVSRLLQKEDIKINVRNRDGRTALHLAIMWKNTECAKMLINDPRCDCNCVTTINNNTPFILACAFRLREVVCMLLQRHDIDINHKNTYGENALMVLLFGNTSFFDVAIQILDDHRCEYNQTDDEKSTLLMKMCRRLNEKITTIIRRLLMFNDIRINAQNIHGDTALHECAKYGNKENALLLLDDARCDKTIKNNKKQTAEEYARLFNEHEIADIIRDHEIDCFS